jgi:hypothetical protein
VRRGLTFDTELLYAGAMFHDMGLTEQYSSPNERLRSTLRPAFQHMHPVIALLTAGVEMDVLGIAYSEFSDTEHEAVVQACPRSNRFKEDIIQAFYDGIRHKPHTAFGNVKADVLADKDPHFTRSNFCSVIRGSAWREWASIQWPSHIAMSKSLSRHDEQEALLRQSNTRESSHGVCTIVALVPT